MKSSHYPLMGYDGDCWTLNCNCGKYLGLHDSAEDASDAFDDHVSAAEECQ